MVIKVFSVRIGGQKVAVLMRRKSEVAIDCTTAELQMKHLVLLRVASGSQDGRF
jgi:hypothetical protein